MVQIEYHDDLNIVQADARLAALLGAPAAGAPFDRLEWWQGLAVHCGLKPLIAIARDRDQALVLPLRQEPARLCELANWYTFRFRPVATPGAPQKLLKALARDLAGRTGRVELAMVPDEDGSASCLETAFREEGWLVMREPCDINHVLDVDGRSHAQFLAGRPGALRTSLKRKGSKVETIVLDRFEDNAWQAFEAIYRASWKPDEGSPAFLREFARNEGRAGRFRLGLALTDDKPVAAQFWTVESGTAFIHKLAHLEAARAFSPGTVLTAAMFARVIDRDRVSFVDFGTGDDAYKRDWMEQARMRYRLVMLQPARPANWPAIGKAILRRIIGNARTDTSGKRGNDE